MSAERASAKSDIRRTTPIVLPIVNLLRQPTGAAVTVSGWPAGHSTASGLIPGPVLLVRRGEVGPTNQMLQSLLADRFKLRVRWETRSFPVYALRRSTTDRLGKNLKPIEADCPAGYPETVATAPVGCAVRIAVNGGRVQGVIPRISDLTNTLAGFTRRRVIDETGIVGRFEFSLAFNPKTVDLSRRSLALKTCPRLPLRCATTWA